MKIEQKVLLYGTILSFIAGPLIVLVPTSAPIILPGLALSAIIVFMHSRTVTQSDPRLDTGETPNAEDQRRARTSKADTQGLGGIADPSTITDIRTVALHIAIWQSIFGNQ